MPKVCVVGSINVDLVAFAARLPSRGETVLGEDFQRFPGGKGANQAVAAARAGAITSMVGAVGNDPFGEWMRTILAAEGIDLSGVETVAASTGVALIMVGGGDNQIVVVPGANGRVDPKRVAQLPFAAGDLCLAQGECAMEAVYAAFTHARAHGAVTLFNPAPASEAERSLLPIADIVTVNEIECAFFTGTRFDVDRPEGAITMAVNALRLRSDQTLVATLGPDGVVAWHRNQTIRLPGHRVVAVDSTGAGDCFVGAFAAALTRGSPLVDALSEANAAAALSVQQKGAQPSFPTRASVAEFIRRIAAVRDSS